MASHAYAKQLEGEAPPSVEEIRALWEPSMRLLDLAPWKRMGDIAVFAVEPEPERLFWGHVMGQSGRVFRIQFYEGDSGFGLLNDLAQGRLAHPVDTFVRTLFTYVDFERPGDIEPLDQEALSLAGLAAQPNTRIPIWRVARKNHLPWYPTREEARLLATCLEVSLAFLTKYLAPGSPHSGVFDGANAAPRIGLDGSISVEPFPGDERAKVAPPEVDEQAAARIAKLKRDSRLSFELDCFPAPFPVGEDDRRPALPSMAVCMDRSLYAYPPVLEVDMDRGQQMVQCLSQTIERVGKRPNEVLVGSRDDARRIAPFCERIGVPVHAAARLSAMADFRASLAAGVGRPRRA